MKILYICDPIEKLNPKKDSTVFLIEKAWERGYETSVCTINELSVVSSSKNPSVYAKTSLISRVKGNYRWWKANSFETKNLTEFDIVFISYDEPNADENYAHLLDICPWAMRSHGVWGSDAAHKAAAAMCESDRFISIDADNVDGDEEESGGQ